MALMAWLSQIFTIISRNVTNMQPGQYAIGLAIVVGASFVLLRGRN